MWIAKSSGRRLVQLAFFCIDFLLLFFAIWVAHTLRLSSSFNLNGMVRIFNDVNFWVIEFFVILSLYIFDLYEPRWWRVAISSRGRLLMALGLASSMSFAWMFLTVSPVEQLFGRGIFLASLCLFVIPAWLYRHYYAKEQQKNIVKNRWLLISSANAFSRVQQELKSKGDLGVWVWLDSAAILKSSNVFEEKMRSDWTGVLVEGQVSPELARALMQARFTGARVMGLNVFYETYWGKVPVESLDNQWFTFEEGFSLLEGQLSRRLKRVGDILISSMMIIGFSPIWLLLLVLIPLESRGLTVYKQFRIGMDNKEFKIYKFRSMRHDSEVGGAQWAKKNDDRVTRLGRLIRRTRLDELPQLLNIFRGQMSFVGPRPERKEFTTQLEKEIPYYQLRHLVKPGLTGWAQVMYPYGASVEDARQKLEFDLYYIKNYSLFLDLKIVIRTISVVLFGAGR
jgi:exopolysaccharide biosynthesis polyprenyl glycosylphosphotransferase